MTEQERQLRNIIIWTITATINACITAEFGESGESDWDIDGEAILEEVMKKIEKDK